MHICDLTVIVVTNDSLYIVKISELSSIYAKMLENTREVT
jgi:hypothetical protein